MNRLSLPFYFINIFLHCCVYGYFVVKPFRAKLRYSDGKTAVIVTLWVFITACFDVVFFEVEAPLFKFVNLGIIILVAISIVVMRVLITGNIMQLIFVFFVLFAFQNNVMVLARLLYKFDFLPPLLPRLGGFNYLFFSVILLLFALPFYRYLFLKLFKKVVDTNLDFVQWKFLFIIPLVYSLYCQVSLFGGVNFDFPRLKDIFTILLLNAFVYLSYVAALQMLLKSYDNYMVTKRADIIDSQLELQKAQYERLTEHIEKTARLQHDWRHHLLLIKSLTEDGNLAELRRYTDAYFNEYSEEDETPVCKNHSVDIILRHYISIAKANGTTVTTSANIPEDIKISGVDLCIVFGNLVENAMESCKKQTSGKRFIDIKAKPVGAQLAIMIQNSYDGEVVKTDEGFLSSKHEGYGIGISSVRGIAETDGGSFDVSYKDNVFKVTALLSKRG